MNEVKTINIRFKYRKTGVFKYLSHLDMLTILARTVSRSGLKVKFSAGFNPKPKLLLSNPIPLGVESRAEYCDIELVEDIDIEKFKDLMNKNLPRPLEVSDAIKINKKIPSVMSQIDLVCYDFEIELKNQNKHDPCIQIPSGTKLTSEGLPRSSPETMHMILSKMNLPPGNFADSIYRYEVLPVKNNIFLLKILGYAKILKGESKSIFKYNGFFSWLFSMAEIYNFVILSSEKSEVFILLHDSANGRKKCGMLTPLEAIF